MSEMLMNNKKISPKRWKKIVFVGIAVIVIVALAFVSWQLWQSVQQHHKDQREIHVLQTKNSDLIKQLAAAKAKISPTDSSAATGTCTPAAVLTSATKDNIAAAISSKNTAALESYMAAAVKVAYAASGKTGTDTPTQAVADLDYVNTNATAPWNFSLSDATVSSYKAGAYKDYFDGTIFVGKSANNYVIAFRFDSCAKIDQIFVAASDSLLL